MAAIAVLMNMPKKNHRYAKNQYLKIDLATS